VRKQLARKPVAARVDSPTAGAMCRRLPGADFAWRQRFLAASGSDFDLAPTRDKQAPVSGRGEKSAMKTLVLAVAGYNLAETGRMIEIAREARRHFNVVFASYGGQFEELIEDEGFALERMSPRLTREELARLRVVLSGETLNTVGYLSAGELAARVPKEIAFFKELLPAAVFTGWCLSVTLSTRAARVPFVNVLHSTTVREYYEAGLQSWPEPSPNATSRSRSPKSQPE